MTINQIIEDSQTLKIEITEYVTKYFQILEVVQKENPRINYQEIDQTTRTRTNNYFKAYKTGKEDAKKGVVLYG